MIDACVGSFLFSPTLSYDTPSVRLNATSFLIPRAFFLIEILFSVALNSESLAVL